MTNIVIVSGDYRPKIFLLKGKIKCCNYDDDYLVRHVLKPWSKIIMTENAFMTHGEWFGASKAIIKSYQQIPVIRDKPQWEILELLDGFGLQEFEPCALELCSNNHIISTKEGSKTLHANQTYDQLVENNNKNIMVETLV